MQDNSAIAHEGTDDSGPTFGWRERRIAGALTRAFGSTAHGRLQVEFPTGASVTVGGGTGRAARLKLESFKPVRRLLMRGSLGLAESYMRAEISTSDLGAVLRFLNMNYRSVQSASGGVSKVRLPDIWWHKRRQNTRRGSRRNIAAHYDLGNDFYKLWLDPGMTYSSGIFREPEAKLEAAQEEKYRVVLDALNLQAGQNLLEIGCGWGGFAQRAAEKGVHVTGLTLSKEQLSYARDRLATAGLASRADLRLEDYRDCSGEFDAIASIEMIEAVGEAHWPRYFETLAWRLKPGGQAVIQSITIDERYFDTYRHQADFIQRYIFPGGMLPTVKRLKDEAAPAGLEFEIIERFGASYAETLRNWRMRFEDRWPEIECLGFDERFRRMWIYYLTYCEVGFESGDVDVGIYRLTKS
jgi:cyclopropane-fatty-acyl-phospholipid synthase